MNAAPDTSARPVDIVCGLDARQMLAAWKLHAAWAVELGRDLNPDEWAEQMKGYFAPGKANLWVAWDGDEPVGVAQLHLVYDPMTRQDIAYGERAYVLPAYRQQDVFTAITDSMMAYAEGIGIKSYRISAEVDLRGRGLQRFYGKYGFKPVSVLLGREL